MRWPFRPTSTAGKAAEQTPDGERQDLSEDRMAEEIQGDDAVTSQEEIPDSLDSAARVRLLERETVSTSEMRSGWKVVGARAAGLSHALREAECQDRFSWALTKRGDLLLAVADGAGSAEASQLGAEIAVATAIGSLTAHLSSSPRDLTEAIASAYSDAIVAVNDEASGLDRSPRDLACTLLVVVLTSDGFAAGQIGDGVSAVRCRESDWDWLIWPSHGEYINSTRFITDENAMEMLRMTSSSAVAIEVALMTDGLEPLALHYKSRTVFPPFLDGLLSPVNTAQDATALESVALALSDFLTSDNVGRRVDDDLTLVLARTQG